jgi:hypothetical protein
MGAVTMAKEYRITRQKLEPVLNSEGTGFSQQWNVGYMVTDGPAEGTTGEIHVPTHQLEPEVVHATIQKMVDKHNAVAAL